MQHDSELAAAAAVCRQHDGSVLVATCAPQDLPEGMAGCGWCLDGFEPLRASGAARGGSGAEVIIARCKHSGCIVALKIHKCRDPTLAMIREAVIHALTPGHPNIVRFYGAFREAGLLVLVLESDLAALDLRTVAGLHDRRRVPERLVRKVLLPPVLSAIAWLHANRTMHLDLKPDNVLVFFRRKKHETPTLKDLDVKLCDFGLSDAFGSLASRCGTAAYMAPELRHPKRGQVLTPKADVWLIGALAYELLVGFVPAAPNVSYPPSVPPDARDFISSCLSPDPAARPPVPALRTHPWLLPKSAL